jgi:asparaginyl-tRNA synthetase
MFNQRTKIKTLLEGEANNQEVTVMGWVRTFRNNQFIALNDGSTNTNLQVVAELGLAMMSFKRITTSAAPEGWAFWCPQGKGQRPELKAARLRSLVIQILKNTLQQKA